MRRAGRFAPFPSSRILPLVAAVTFAPFPRHIFPLCGERWVLSVAKVWVVTALPCWRLGGWDSIAGEGITAAEHANPVKAEGLADDVGAVLSFMRWFCLSLWQLPLDTVAGHVPPKVPGRKCSSISRAAHVFLRIEFEVFEYLGCRPRFIAPPLCLYRHVPRMRLEWTHVRLVRHQSREVLPGIFLLEQTDVLPDGIIVTVSAEI